MAVKRFKKVLKIGAIALGALLVLLLIANAILIWITGSRLEERIAAIRDAGEPVTLADLDRPEPPAGQNSATYFRRARNDADALAKELNRITGSTKSIETEKKAVQSAMEAYPRVILSLEQAAACSDFHSDLDFTGDPQQLLDQLLGEFHQFREYAMILRAQSILLRTRGKYDDALRASLVSLRLSRHLEREPLVLSSLVVIACRSVAIGQANATLRAGPVSKTLRAELERELTRCDDLNSFQQVLKGERAYAISFFRTTMPYYNWTNHWFNRALMNAMELNVIDELNEQIEAAIQPYSAFLANEAKFKRKARGYLHTLAALQLPAIFKTREALERGRALARCLRVLNALQQHLPSAGKELKLSELGLPAEAVTDPYDGSLLTLKKVDGEWLIYCVGPNLKDDGGKLDDYSDAGVGPVKPDIY